MLVRILLLLLLLSPAALRGQATEFPKPPDGQILDTGGWLGENRRANLEAELGRYRKEYEIDVMVILWDHGLPPETSLEELADRLGETWAREDLWLVVVHIPDSLRYPAVVAGGPATGSVREEALSGALLRAIDRGMKERTTRAQVEALALEAGEEFVFLRNRSALEQKLQVAAQHQQARTREASHETMILRALVVTLLALAAVGALAVVYLLKRHPNHLEFPNTRWRSRLGAKWSGGGHIVVSLPTRTS